MMDRRTFLHAGSVAIGASLVPELASGTLPSLAAAKVGMCDWNLGTAANPGDIEKGVRAGLDGVQVSVGTTPDRMPLRDPAVRSQYLELARRHGIAYPSGAAGTILNRIPLKSEPQSAVYVIDAVEAAAALGATNILVAFFSNGDLREKNSAGEFRNVSTGPFREYALDEQGVTRVVEALRQIAPRARDAGIFLGLENTLTARQNLEILERVGSPMVKVYYDVGNSTFNGYDVPGEIRRLGRDLICEMHIKESPARAPSERALLGTATSGGVDFRGAAQACRDIGYDRWYILETSGRPGHFEEDTRANIAFVKRVFG